MPLTCKGLLLQWEEPKSSLAYFTTEARAVRVQEADTKTSRGLDLLKDHLGRAPSKQDPGALA